jgi:SAM-dependent methyltransferase
VPPGDGLALDLGGGLGELRRPLERLGYRYVNVDLTPGAGRGAVGGDAHGLPFCSDTFDIVISSDSMEHFIQPIVALSEARRVLKPTGSLVIWVPFMHPFHGNNDYYRYTPLGLRYVLREAQLELVSLEAPLWVFSVVAQALVVLLQRLGLGSLERPVERVAASLDGRLHRARSCDASFAAAYLAVARRSPEGP